MRAMWKGAVAFGLVNVPVKLYTATSQHDVSLHMVHREDGGRIRYRKTCTVDGEEVPADEIARAHTTDDGQMVVIDDDDLDSLPVSSSQEIEVQEFVPAEQVDPIMFDKTYYLEPEARAAKPYALLREALRETDRMAVVTITVRRRESMAVLRVRDDVIVLQTLLWPDEVRAADFEVLQGEVDVRPQELAMASSLVESMASDFDPDQYSDGYTEALKELIAAKAEDGDARPAPVDRSGDDGDAQIVDLMAALRASVERTGTARRGATGGASSVVDEGTDEDDAASDAGSGSASGKTSGTAESSRPAAKRTTARKATAKGSAADKTPAGKTAAPSRSTAKKTTAAKTTAKKTTAKKTTATRTTAAPKRSTAARSAAAPAKKATSAKRATPATKTTARKSAATKTTASRSPAKREAS
ncbi:Ku protein [Aquipuribacter sp. MA13-6]|uniref:non-homologous end joining protein Ku n=1 Tax=unclassified Aquipuribacter TaxID=2635084 RepID=UPI003EEFCCD6